MADPARIQILYIACQTPDSIGNFQLNCDTFNESATSDVDQRQHLIDEIAALRKDIGSGFIPNCITAASRGNLHAMAYDFQREGRWRFLVVVAKSDEGDLSAYSDVETRLKDLLLLLWKYQNHYKHPEDRIDLMRFLDTHNMVPGTQRIAEDVRTGPQVLLDNFLTTRLTEDEEETSGLIGSPGLPDQEEVWMLRFLWCFVLFWVIWFCCLCILAGLCLCATIVFAYLARMNNI